MAQISIDGGNTFTTATDVLQDQRLAPHWSAIRGAMDPAVVAEVEGRMTETNQRQFLDIYLTEAQQNLVLDLNP